MRVSEIKNLFPQIQEFSVLPETIKKVVRSSDAFESGDIFVAIKGTSWDGHSFIPNCIGRASLIFLADSSLVDTLIEEKQSFCLVEDTRETFGKLCDLMSGFPSRDMFCVGVTGTNGKTTTNYCIEHLLNSIAYNTAVMGTIDHHLRDKTWPTNLTSPGPEVFYSRLQEMKQAGANALCIEMSSHALDQKRNHELQLDVAIFTNLTQDHLDYHKNMQDYFKAKEKLVTEVLSNSSKAKKLFSYNGDDSYANQFNIPSGIETISFGFSAQNLLQIYSNKEDFSGLDFDLSYQGNRVSFKSKLVGHFNLYNIASMVSVGLFLGKSLEDLKPIVESLKGVPGRLEKVPSKNAVSSFVDFAHTPDALDASLSFLYKLKEESGSKGKIICVFGAGGDRDRGKRPLMAQAAQKYSDYIILCSDNPRTEDPLSILQDIEKGFTGFNSYELIENRKEAIYRALSMAKENDVILVAGKGHEAYQEINKVKYDFSDQEVLRSFKE